MTQLSFHLILFLILSFNATGSIAQPSYQVAIVQSRTMAPYALAVEGLQQELRKLKIDAQFNFYNIEGDIQKGEEISKRILERRVVLVFAIGTEAFKALSGYLNEIPIITVMLVDPEGEGIVAKDKTNVYGAYLKVPFEQIFHLIKKIVPDLNPIALIYLENRNEAVSEALAAADQGGISLVPFKIDSVKEFSKALDEISKRSKALLMTIDNELYNSATVKELLLFSARNKFPIIAFSPSYVKSGALLSFSSNFLENGKSAARLSVPILQGKPVKQRFVPTENVWTAWNKHVAGVFKISLPREGGAEIDEYA